jgi:hypothetical protein
MNLSKNFPLEEMIHSQDAVRAGLKNFPNAAQIESLTALCVNVLEPLRERVKKPIIVSSGFRSVTINRRIGGSKTSQHTKGEAADFRINGMTTSDIVKLIIKMGLPFDQVIEEFGSWVHVSHKKVGPQRGQALRARRIAGKTVYQPFEG